MPEKITITAHTLDDVLSFLRKAQAAADKKEIAQVPAVVINVQVTLCPGRGADGKLL